MSWFRRSSVGTSNLPPGDLGTSFVGNTFNFHHDAQQLILSNLRQHPDAPIIRAKVIGRDVALVVDYSIASDVLDRSAGVVKEEATSSKHTRFSHQEAYKQLIATFFSEPNILLEDEDEPNRPNHRAGWDDHLSYVLRDGWKAIQIELETVIEEHLRIWTKGSTSNVDLYTSCKDLSHDLIFKLLLDLTRSAEPELYYRALATSDTSSKGQFAIPLKANLGGMFETTYSRGLRAQGEFNEIISTRVSNKQCPFLKSEKGLSIGRESLDSHISMFSSSLVVKALSSYLTFVFLQYSYCSTTNLDWLLLEAERLCPPIIGVLRRILDEPWKPNDRIEVPIGWDAWLYFPLINRDSKVYGSDANRFRAERWADPEMKQPMTFGRGAKTCLARDLVRKIGKLVLQVIINHQVKIVVEGELESSVQDFLGWRDDEGLRKDGWPGVKQLPVQRPRDPVMVRFERNGS